jgi:hypothetical protein
LEALNSFESFSAAEGGWLKERGVVVGIGMATGIAGRTAGVDGSTVGVLIGNARAVLVSIVGTISFLAGKEIGEAFSYPLTSLANSSLRRCPSSEPLGLSEEDRTSLLFTTLKEYVFLARGIFFKNNFLAEEVSLLEIICKTKAELGCALSCVSSFLSSSYIALG